MKLPWQKLKAVRELNGKIKEFDKDFFMVNNRLPSNNDYALSDEMSHVFTKHKAANKIIKEWGITIHLV